MRRAEALLGGLLRGWQHCATSTAGIIRGWLSKLGSLPKAPRNLEPKPLLSLEPLVDLLIISKTPAPPRPSTPVVTAGFSDRDRDLDNSTTHLAPKGNAGGLKETTGYRRLLQGFYKVYRPTIRLQKSYPPENVPVGRTEELPKP